MFIGFLVINFIIYSSYCMASYSESFKASSYFYPLCITISLIGNFLWLIYVKNIKDPTKIYIDGVIWDFTIIAAFFIIPFIFFKIKLNYTSILGLALVVFGTIMMKYGEFKEAKDIKISDKTNNSKEVSKSK